MNHFSNNTKLTTKAGLAVSLWSLSWFNEVNLDSFFPQCFNLSNSDDLEDFKQQFKLLKAEAILKRFVEKEQISLEIVETALKVTQRRLYSIDDFLEKKQNFEFLINDKEWDKIGYDELSAEEWVKKTYETWMKKNNAKSPTLGKTKKNEMIK